MGVVFGGGQHELASADIARIEVHGTAAALAKALLQAVGLDLDGGQAPWIDQVADGDEPPEDMRSEFSAVIFGVFKGEIIAGIVHGPKRLRQRYHAQVQGLRAAGEHADDELDGQRCTYASHGWPPD